MADGKHQASVPAVSTAAHNERPVQAAGEGLPRGPWRPLLMCSVMRSVSGLGFGTRRRPRSRPRFEANDSRVEPRAPARRSSLLAAAKAHSPLKRLRAILLMGSCGRVGGRWTPRGLWMPGMRILPQEIIIFHQNGTCAGRSGL